jgi:1,4-dihydroxy-6-naphthoate synthase
MDETLIRIGHSPDPDDAFMFWALAKDKLPTGNLRFEHVLKDIETLNKWGLEGRLEITALSLHAYPYVQDKYVLLPHGASMGDGYGPIVVCRPGTELPSDPAQLKVAIPGTMTSAFLELNLWMLEKFGARATDVTVVEFDEIPQYVLDGKADFGLLIHEGQLTYEKDGLELVVDLGVWWAELTGGLPLPLGVNAVRSDLSPELQQQLCDILGRSIDLGLEHREEALEYALQFGRGLDTGLADQFVGMYVNDLTRDYGDRGRQAIAELLARAEEAGLFADPLVGLPPVENVQVRWLEGSKASAVEAL